MNKRPVEISRSFPELAVWEWNSRTISCPPCTSTELLGHVPAGGELKKSPGTTQRIRGDHSSESRQRRRVPVFPAEPSNEMIAVNDGVSSLHQSPAVPSAHRSGKQQPLLPLTEIHFGVIEDIQTRGGKGGGAPRTHQGWSSPSLTSSVCCSTTSHSSPTWSLHLSGNLWKRRFMTLTISCLAPADVNS